MANLLGTADPDEALGILGGLPTSIVVIKMGAEGCLVHADGGSWQVGVSPGPVQDVTGAGDAFCGGFAASISLGISPIEAACCGAVSAGFAVSRFSSLSLAAVGPQEAKRRRVEAAPPVTPRPTITAAAARSATPGDARAIDVMRREISTIPDVIASQLSALGPRLTELARAFTHDRIERIVLTGCGDSWFAGWAASLSLLRTAGIRTTAPSAMELARYRVRYLPPNTAVVCISYSGQVGRTIEAAVQARRFGHRVVALTGQADSRLAAEAEEVILIDVPTLGFSPGTSTYVALVTALLELAGAWGEARGAPGASEARAALRRIPEAAERTIAACLEPSRAVAQTLLSHQWIQVLGAGPNEATARFGAAKFLEGPQRIGAAANLEEWAHEEYFVTRPGSPVIVIGPLGASFDRALEICSELRFIGADATLITDATGVPDGVRPLRLAPGLAEEHTPLLAALPLSLVAFFLAVATGKRSYNFPNVGAEREHYETIHRDTLGEPA